MKKALIVGGGFGGVSAALELAKHRSPNLEIVLLSDKPHFEYHAALYRVVAGDSALQTCLPLDKIFRGSAVVWREEFVTGVDLKRRVATGRSGREEPFDYLILALGSQTCYFNVPGLAEFSFGFKSTSEALRLKRHLESAITLGGMVANRSERNSLSHLIIVGGGPSGVELAGELAVYARVLAHRHGVDPGLVTIDLIEAAPRLLPTLPADVSERVRRRLHALGVNIFLNRPLLKEEIDGIMTGDLRLESKTVVWTAGVETNALYSRIHGLQFDRRGRVVVNDFLQAPAFPGVFVIGDAAATAHTGMAQTAVAAGRYAAHLIAGGNRRALPFRPKAPAYAVPVGPGWAATLIRGWRFYGRLGWWLRRWADLNFFLSILPPRLALLAFRNGARLTHACPICAPATKVSAAS